MVEPEMLARLEQLATEIGALQSKLILIVGTPHTGKTALLEALAKKRGVSVFSVGSELGNRISAVPQRQRHLQTTALLRELADQHATGDLLLLDNLELLFDRTLQLDPLDLLKRHGGATSKELRKATGWLPHSVRGFLSGTVGKKMGLTVTSTKGEDGERTYSVEI